MTALALGFVLGFIGYLPPGNINLTVVQLALGPSVKRLWLFLLLATIMEFVYCAGCLTGLDILIHQAKLLIVLKWASVFIFALLGLLCLFHKENTSKAHAYSGLRRGVFMVIVNPLQIPFWLVWGAYLTDNKWITVNTPATLLFAFITASGSFCVLWIYAEAGKKITETMKLERRLIDRIIGVILITLALWELFRLLHK